MKEHMVTAAATCQRRVRLRGCCHGLTVGKGFIGALKSGYER